MRIPTHIVIDTTDGWTWARDQQADPFTESTATEWAAILNAERKTVDEKMGRTRTGFIVAAVTPVMSEELMTALITDQADSTVAAIEEAGFTATYDPEHPLDEIKGTVE